MIASFFCSPDRAMFLTNLATLISVFLGFYSILYSSRANKKTDALLEEIRSEFKNIANDASSRLSEKNFDEENYKNVSDMLNKKR